jgi:hypothetical protein
VGGTAVGAAGTSVAGGGAAGASVAGAPHAARSMLRIIITANKKVSFFIFFSFVKFNEIQNKSFR